MRRYLIAVVTLVVILGLGGPAYGQDFPPLEPGDSFDLGCQTTEPNEPDNWYVSCFFDSAVGDFATVGFGVNPDGLIVRGFVHEGYVAGDLDSRGLRGGGDFDRTPRIRRLAVCRAGRSVNIPPEDLNTDTDELGFCDIGDFLRFDVLMGCTYKPNGAFSFLTVACEGEVNGREVQLNLGDHRRQLFVSTVIEGSGWVAATVEHDQSVQIAGGYTW